jgi:hypothetical protein
MLSDEEMVSLINEAVRPRSVSIALGGRLEDVPGNEWAFEWVEEFRKQVQA